MLVDKKYPGLKFLYISAIRKTKSVYCCFWGFVLNLITGYTEVVLKLARELQYYILYSCT